MDHQKLYEFLELVKPNISFDEGLKKTINWFRKCLNIYEGDLKNL